MIGDTCVCEDLLEYKKTSCTELNPQALDHESSTLLCVVLCVCQDLLEYKKKHRVLRVKMLDGSVKTLMVDDSHTVAQLMITVCSKIGLYTPYSLASSLYGEFIW